MRVTDKRLSDQECRDVLLQIIKIILSAFDYSKPVKKGFKSRMEMCGYNIITLLRMQQIMVPGEQNQQERLEI